MIVFEIEEDKVGKVMKAVSKISEHAECLHDLFEDMLSEDNYDNRKHSDGDFYGSRYGMRRNTRRY